MKTKQWLRISVVVAACAVALTFAADDKKPEPNAGDAAWMDLQKSFRPPQPPEEWRTKEPTKAQIEEFEKKNGVLAGEAADKAKDFYTKFPSHPKAKDAQTMELKLLEVAGQLGQKNPQAQVERVAGKRRKKTTPAGGGK